MIVYCPEFEGPEYTRDDEETGQHFCAACGATDHRPWPLVDQRGGGRQAQQASDAVRAGRYSEGGRDV